MHPILLSIFLGLTAAAANIFGGAIIVHKHWDRSYLKYFVALGAGFIWAWFDREQQFLHDRLAGTKIEGVSPLISSPRDTTSTSPPPRR